MVVVQIDRRDARFRGFGDAIPARRLDTPPAVEAVQDRGEA
jgi:hypothetical protein